MTKVNSFRSNYMARRAELFGIIQSNPYWCHYSLVSEGQYNALGWVLHTLGVSDDDIDLFGILWAISRISQEFELKSHTIAHILELDDQALSFSQSVRAIRKYLLGKNLQKAYATAA